MPRRSSNDLPPEPADHDESSEASSDAEWNDQLADALDDDSLLDDEFPLGDGVAELTGVVECPYCGETVEIALDPGSGNDQQYVEDCQVCCRPWNVSVHYDEDGTAHVYVDANDDMGDGDD